MKTRFFSPGFCKAENRGEKQIPELSVQESLYQNNMMKQIEIYKNLF